MAAKQLAGLAVVLIVLICLIAYAKGHSAQPALPSETLATTTEGAQFSYEVVTDPAAQARGLGGRSDVPEDYGMLFVFPTDQNDGFWMKDMRVPIDIIWLSDTGAILKIDGSVSPSTYPSVFYPPEPVRYVLETRAGEAQRQGWSVGAVLSIPSQK